MADIAREIASIRALDLRTASVEQVKHRLASLLPAVLINRRLLQFSTLWRARVTAWGERFNTIRDLWYPPSARVARLGRANNIGRSVFYCCDHPYTATIETKGPLSGPFILLLCEAKDPRRPAMVIPLGLGRDHPRPGGGQQQRETPNFLSQPRGSLATDAFALETFLREEFTKQVPTNGEHLYKITVALSELLLDTAVSNGPPTDGIVTRP